MSAPIRLAFHLLPSWNPLVSFKRLLRVKWCNPGMQNLFNQITSFCPGGRRKGKSFFFLCGEQMVLGTEGNVILVSMTKETWQCKIAFTGARSLQIGESKWKRKESERKDRRREQVKENILPKKTNQNLKLWFKIPQAGQAKQKLVFHR